MKVTSCLSSSVCPLSLIVIGLNADEICLTLKSLVPVSERIAEILVIDSSTDLAFSPAFQQLSPLFSNLSLHYSKPQGVVHAFNVGLDLSSFEFVCYINSGDSCLPLGFNSALDMLFETQPDLVISPVVVDHGAYQSIFRGIDRKGNIVQVHQQGTIYRKSLHLTHGTYSSIFDCAMDTAFFASVLRSRSDYQFSINSEPAALFRSGGISSQKKYRTIFEFYFISALSSRAPFLFLLSSLPMMTLKILFSFFKSA